MLSPGCLVVQAQEFAKVLVPLFKQLSKCLNSSHFQVGLCAMLTLPHVELLLAPATFLADEQQGHSFCC